jgi:ABC-type sugar transport system ATPase subunit
VFNRPASFFVAGFIGTPTMNFFNARYSGDGRLQGDGFAVLAPRWLREQRPSAGQDLTLGVRPQTLRIANGSLGGEPATFTVQVDVVEYLGTESQIVGHLSTPGGQRVSAVVPGDGQALLHTRLGLDVDPETLHVFDSASGRSLRP